MQLMASEPKFLQGCIPFYLIGMRHFISLIQNLVGNLSDYNLSFQGLSEECLSFFSSLDWVKKEGPWTHTS